MQKYSLLDMVQLILNDMDGDNVNSIDETTESQQVASIIRQNYNALLSVGDWPHLKKVGKLVSLNDTSRPTHMKMPKGTLEVIELYYNKDREDLNQKRYTRIKYVRPEEWLRKTNGRNSEKDNVIVVEDPLVDMLIMNDRHPSFYTSFDDEHLVFDSFDNEREATLQATNTQIIYNASREMEMTNSFVPDLPVEMFSQLLEMSKSNAFIALKGAANPDADYKASRLRRWNARKARRSENTPHIPNYGRK